MIRVRASVRFIVSFRHFHVQKIRISARPRVRILPVADGVTAKMLLKIVSVIVGFCERLQLSTIH